MVLRLEFYSVEDLCRILKRSAALLRIECSEAAAREIARCARGTPRIANRLLKRVRDFATECAGGAIHPQVVRDALAMLHIDERGLDQMDRAILTVIIDKFGGGPVGVETIAAALGEDAETIEDVYEPFLLQEGLIARTRRGRETTTLGYEHVGRVPPASPQMKLLS